MKQALSLVNMTISKKINWKRCQKCSFEFGNLIDGICFGCHENENKKIIREATVKFKMIEFVGPYGYENFTLDKFQASPENKSALSWAKGFNPERENVYLWGPAGTGKTHLAAAVMGKFMKERGPGRTAFERSSKMFRFFQSRKGWEQDEKIGFLGKHCDLLVFDDLGVEKDSEFSARILHEILDDRKSWKKNGMIVTSNLSPSDFARRVDDRVASRLFGMCKTIKIGGQDGRLKR